MKTNFLVGILLLFLFSCGKKYQCNCYSTKDGKLVYTYSERNKRKDHVEASCETAYHNSTSFVDPSHCEIK